MSLLKKKIKITCNRCGDVKKLKANSFRDAIIEVEKNGWYCVIVGHLTDERWECYCRECMDIMLSS